MPRSVAYSHIMTTRVSILIVTTIAFTLALLVFSSNASAQQAQAWVPSSTPVINPGLEQFSDSKLRERVGRCVDPTGNFVISKRDEASFANAVNEAFEKYDKKLEEKFEEAEEAGWELEENDIIGFSRVATIEFKNHLNSRLNNRTRNLVDMTALSPEGVIAPALANGCELHRKITIGDSLPDFSITGIVLNTGKFISDAIFFIPKVIVSFMYNAFSDIALKYAMITPHVERGETMFTLLADSADERTQILGFDESLLDSKKLAERQQATSYLNFMRTITYLMSATFTIIALGFALMLMRPDWTSDKKVNAMKIIPRLLVAALVMILGPWILGGLITMSNYFTVAVMSGFGCPAAAGSSCTSMSDLNLIIIQVMQNLGTPGSFVLGAIPIVGKFLVIGDIVINSILNFMTLVVMGMMAWLFLAIFALAIVRQILLIMVMVLLGVAATAIVFDSTRSFFMTYMKGIIALLAVAPATALVIKIGATINPLANTSMNAGGGEAFVGMVALVITLWIARRVPTALRKWATGKSGQTLTGKAMGWAGSGAKAAAYPVAVTAGPWAGAAVGAAGAGLSSASKADKQMTDKVASLSPNWTQGMGDTGRGFVRDASYQRRRVYGELATAAEREMARRRGGSDNNAPELDIEPVGSGVGEYKNVEDDELRSRYDEQNRSGKEDPDYEFDIGNRGELQFRPRVKEDIPEPSPAQKQNPAPPQTPSPRPASPIRDAAEAASSDKTPKTSAEDALRSSGKPVDGSSGGPQNPPPQNPPTGK